MLNIELAYEPAIPFLGFYAGEWKAYVHTTTCTKIFIALFIVTKKWKHPQCPLTEESVHTDIQNV